NEPQHYTYSKVWSWVALTRAVELSRQMGTDAPVDAWKREAEAIRTEVLDRAWNADLGAFTQFYGSDELDASVLVMPSVGFIHANEPRFQQTLTACVERLKAGRYPLLYRYLNDDGVGGAEGAFLLPSFWMAEALALAGNFRQA